MRMYQPAWIQLKSNPKLPLVIAAAPALHPRIYKAIIKEKWLDTPYKSNLAARGYRSELSRESNDGMLSITLTLIPTLDGLF